MILNLILIILIWEWIASMITAAILVKSINISKVDMEEMTKWIDDNTKTAITLTILNFPMLTVTPIICIFYKYKTKK